MQLLQPMHELVGWWNSPSLFNMKGNLIKIMKEEQQRQKLKEWRQHAKKMRGSGLNQQIAL